MLSRQLDAALNKGLMAIFRAFQGISTKGQCSISGLERTTLARQYEQVV
jgi:hypothetical protein